MSGDPPAPPLPPLTALLLDGVVVAAALTLTFAAIAAADARASYAAALWFALPIAFLLATAALAWARGDYLRSGRGLVLRDIAHWAATLALLLAHRSLIDQGALADAGAGLVDGLIVALATLLTGVHGHWRLLPVGAAIVGVCYAVTYLEHHLWATVAIALTALIGSVLIGRARRRRERLALAR